MKKLKETLNTTASGFTYPFRAGQLIKQTPRLLKYILIPIAVNIILGAALYALIFIPSWQGLQSLLTDYGAWHQAQINRLPDWLGWLGVIAEVLSFLLRALLVGGLFFLLGFLLVQFGTILGAPWYGRLSEKIEEQVSGELISLEVGILKDIGRAIHFEIMKIILTLGMAVLGLLMGLIPLVGVLLASGLSFALALVLVCLDFLDPALERIRLPFFKKIGIVFRQFPGSASFGLIVFFLISIPIVNFVTIPLCVAGGTLFYSERIR